MTGKAKSKMMKKWIASFTLLLAGMALVGCDDKAKPTTQTSTPPVEAAPTVEATVVLNEIHTAANLLFEGATYTIKIHNECKVADPTASMCQEVEMEIMGKTPDAKAIKLEGRTMNHANQKPSLFAYTVSDPESNKTYIVSIEEKELFIILNGENTLQEKGELTVAKI